MYILNQDRDKIIEFTNEDTLWIQKKETNNVTLGINVMLNEEAVGTFDSIKEAVEEIQRIISCQYPYYVIQGFIDYMNCF